jgi:1-hydroxycarotenoid 3,4-desaturase
MATLIIGAGIGGLSAAIALAAQGEPVQVLERQAGAGGKLLPITIEGQSIDSGPTVLTMLWVFEDLFQRAGLSLHDAVTLHPLTILARHFWRGGAMLDLHADRQATADAIGKFAGPQNAKGYLAFAATAERIHKALLTPFLKNQRPTPWGLAAAMPPSELLRINPFETLWSALGRYFPDPRLRQLFGRYATYCGSSPFKAPATLMLVADVEASGVWKVAGGLAALAEALYRAAIGLGVTFRFSRDVEDIVMGRRGPVAVRDKAGERYPCNAVIINGDSAALAAGLFGKSLRCPFKPPASDENSLSAITWCGQISHEGPPLEHHTVFFSDDYAAEFKHLQSGAADDPTVYVCEQGGNNKLVLINAPARVDVSTSQAEFNVARRLQSSGHSLNLLGPHILKRGPRDFAALYPATQGALYGRATQGWLSTFQRPQARTAQPGLYLAGGSTHPGPGVPMAALSGLRAVEALLQDRALMRQ